MRAAETATTSLACDLPPSAELTFRALLRTLGLLKRVMEPHFARFGLSGAQWGVLRTLSREEEAGRRSLRLTDLGNLLIVRPPSVSGVVERLHRMGLVRRAAGTDDQRVKYVSLTEAGRKLVARVLQEHPRQVGSIMSELDRAEQHQLGQLLAKLGGHLETLAGRGHHADRNGGVRKADGVGKTDGDDETTH
jgi:MarR family 2-MHQ and catechol resistance regulon transcriptional repressor